MNILVVDDEASQRDMLSGFLRHQGHDVLTAASGQEARAVFQRAPVQLVLLDQRMPGESGEELLRYLKEVNPLVRAIMITAFSSVHTAVAVMKLGADEFLEKPVDLDELLAKIQAIEQQAAIDCDVTGIEAAIENRDLPLNIIAKSQAMKRVLSLAGRLAGSPWPVLIQGETGTGKELLAHLIHLLSTRKDGGFIALNCAAIPENLFESELFGHEKGSFTGAAGRRRGHFELADGGTLFLDEITELPLPMQPKLLRAIQEKHFARIGGEQQITVDARLIAATNRDISRLAAGGQFRQDLYYRIKVLELEIPPLRARREDIPPLIEFFLQRYADRPYRLAPEALDALIKYPFPGNVRELEHIVQRSITLARGTLIDASILPFEVRQYQASTQGTLEESLEAMEKELLCAALEKTGWVQTRAAEALGISERVLRYKMKKHGLAAPIK
jgi:two-component system response regulator AtoC